VVVAARRERAGKRTTPGGAGLSRVPSISGAIAADIEKNHGAGGVFDHRNVGVEESTRELRPIGEVDSVHHHPGNFCPGPFNERKNPALGG